MNAKYKHDQILLLVTAIATCLLLGCMHKADTDQPFKNTIFAEGFSFEKFVTISEGDSLAKVLETLGLPLKLTINPITNFPWRIQSPTLMQIKPLASNVDVNIVLQYALPAGASVESYWSAAVTVCSNNVSDIRFELYWE